ncbi:MAG: hypothetical protein ACFFD4_24175 [Candidatus Odinarchaeota archaeon]
MKKDSKKHINGQKEVNRSKERIQGNIHGSMSSKERNKIKGATGNRQNSVKTAYQRGKEQKDRKEEWNGRYRLEHLKRRKEWERIDKKMVELLEESKEDQEIIRRVKEVKPRGEFGVFIHDDTVNEMVQILEKAKKR